MKPHHRMPESVFKICYYHSGVLLGGSVDYVIGKSDEIPKDYDVVVPLDCWKDAVVEIPKGATINSFGGFKYQEGDVKVDVWPDDLARAMFKYMFGLAKAYSLKQNRLLEVHSAPSGV